MQYFNYCEYNHHVINCKYKFKYEKYAERHDIKECNNIIIQYIHCKNLYET